MSTKEAEYVGASIACIAVTHYQYLDDKIENMGFRNYNWAEEKMLALSVILTNTQATSINSNNPKTSLKSCHIEQRYRYITVGSKRKRHILLFVETTFQLADIKTKATTKESHR